jgi:hypothetical protein
MHYWPSPANELEPSKSGSAAIRQYLMQTTDKDLAATKIEIEQHLDSSTSSFA